MEGKKRSYTVPVLLLIITGMALVLVLAFTRLLVANQALSTEAGKRLAEQYQEAVKFAERLRDGSELLLRGGSAADRMRAKMQLGEAAAAAGQTADLLAEAVRRNAGVADEDVIQPVADAMTALAGPEKGVLYGTAEHEGPLTEEEQRILTAVRDAAASMAQELASFKLPVGDIGYRSMAGGEGWIEPAQKAADLLTALAARLQNP